MEPEARYTLIGAVLLALVAAAVGAFVWLSSSGRSSDFQFYTVYFERQSLEGLQIGGDVNMRGVKVGRVENYTISRDNINRVAVTLRVDRTMPVSENTTAVVARNLVTGIARINLDTPGKPGPALVSTPAGERFPVIPEGTSDLDQIADSVSRLAVQADTALENINRVLGPANQAAFGETLVALRDLSQGLNQRLSALDAASRSVQSVAGDFAKSSRAFNGAVDSFAGMIQPLGQDARATLQDARASLQAFSESGRNLEASVNRSLQVFDRNVGGLARRADDALEVSVHELRNTAEELRTSLELMSRTLDRLQDPKASLVGPSPQQFGPGEEPRR